MRRRKRRKRKRRREKRRTLVENDRRLFHITSVLFAVLRETET